MGDLRVISGLWRGRWIKAGRAGQAAGLRPTSDRVRTSLFDRLSPILPGARVLDLFAGTGALGIEAMSRGAAEVVFVEKAPGVLRILDANLKTLEARNAAVVGDDAFRVLKSLSRTAPFDVILADPPYEEGIAGRLVARLDEEEILRTAGLFVVEHSRREELPPVSGSLEELESRRYGDTLLTFYIRK